MTVFLSALKIATQATDAERLVSLPPCEGPNNFGVEAEQAADAKMRELAVFCSMIDPRPRDLEVAGHVIRVPQAIAVRGRRSDGDRSCRHPVLQGGGIVIDVLV